MKLIGEVYELLCPHCSVPVQVVIKPDSHRFDPVVLPNTAGLANLEIDSSTFECPECGFPISIIGYLIFVVGDVEEFDEIEQHR